jgi:hypothetical protein
MSVSFADLPTYVGWAAIELSKPLATTSNKVAFTLTCMPTPG